MEIIIPKFSGFCPGVKNAEKEIFKLIENFHNNKITKKFFLIGPLIHNRFYINLLKEKNIIIIEEKDLEFLSDDKIIKNEHNLYTTFFDILKKYNLNFDDIPVIRTHGIPMQFDLFLKKYFNKIIDLTCFKIKKIQKLIKNYDDQNYFVIISGKKEHPEIISLKSFAKNSFIIQKKDEIDSLLFYLEKNNIKNILLISQTTYEKDIFDFTKNKLLNYINEYEKIKKDKIKLISHNTICEITEKREKETLKYLNDVDFIIVIGDKSSSNSLKLYNFIKNFYNYNIEYYKLRDYNLKKNEKLETIFFIQNKEELLETLKEKKISFNNETKIMIVSSSSTPEILENEIKKTLLTLEI